MKALFWGRHWVWKRVWKSQVTQHKITETELKKLSAQDKQLQFSEIHLFKSDIRATLFKGISLFSERIILIECCDDPF